MRVFWPYNLQARGAERPPRKAPSSRARGPLRTLARPDGGENDGSMASLVHNLDHVAWALLTAVLAVTALALLGFIFLAAI